MPSAALQQTVRALMPQAREDLARLVAFRSVADPAIAPPRECEQAAAWVADALESLGMRNVEAHLTPDGSRAVFGETEGGPGAPTVLLYSHYDVQPAGDEQDWDTPPFSLTEGGGRWYGRGTADCKGNLVMHLTALRALAGTDHPATVKMIVEGSEEQGTGGLEAFVGEHAELLAADVIVIADAGNVAVGVPTLTTSLRGMANVIVTVRTLHSAVHSGSYGGAAPDALAALIAILSTLRDERGNTTVAGLPAAQSWPGAPYPPERFRADATVRGDVALLGDGAVADMVWARPAATVLGIDCPPVSGSLPAITPLARARVNLRVAPGESAVEAQQALIAHLRAAAPWNVELEVTPDGVGEPFAGRTDGPAYVALTAALRDAYGRDVVSVGQGGSIPLCRVLADTFPQAEIALMGVEDPASHIHAVDESVDPAEIEHMALAEALFLQSLG